MLNSYKVQKCSWHKVKLHNRISTPQLEHVFK